MLCRKDPCGIVCIALTYMMLLHCLYVILFVMIIPLFNESFYGTVNGLIICTLVTFAILSHARAAYFDPGFVPIVKRTSNFSDDKTTDSANSLLKFAIDAIYIDQRAPIIAEYANDAFEVDTHEFPRLYEAELEFGCQPIRVGFALIALRDQVSSVHTLDHHCPWVNNCVGEFNQKYFILFLFYIGATSVYVILFIIWALIVFPQKTESQIIHSVVIGVEACLFGIFVLTVFVDQVQSILADRSLIDTLKLDENERTAPQSLPPKRVLFRKVFGSGPILCWLCPCDLKRTSPTPSSIDMYHV